MKVEIGNLILEKAGQGNNYGLVENDKLLPIVITAHNMTKDRDGHRMTQEAFSKPSVDYFIRNGDIEWFHLSRKEKDPKYLLGKPSSFLWEDNLPKVPSYLFKDKKMVKEDIQPMLESGLENVLSASMGGFITKIKSDGDVSSMIWDHIAIAPASQVKSQGGANVVLAKAGDGSTEAVTYPSFCSFSCDIEKGDRSEMMKALVAEAVTSADNPGSSFGPVQGLPGSVYSDNKRNISDAEYQGVLNETLKYFKSGIIGPKSDVLLVHFYRTFEDEAMAISALEDFLKMIKEG